MTEWVSYCHILRQPNEDKPVAMIVQGLDQLLQPKFLMPNCVDEPTNIILVYRFWSLVCIQGLLEKLWVRSEDTKSQC